VNKIYLANTKSSQEYYDSRLAFNAQKYHGTYFLFICVLFNDDFSVTQATQRRVKGS
jgi:hypothetical protein